MKSLWVCQCAAEDDAGEKRKHAYFITQIYAVCIATKSAKTVMFHWLIGSVSLWAELDSFQGGMQEFWLVGEHTKWTQTILDTCLQLTLWT